jgi:hypothetical protein
LQLRTAAIMYLAAAEEIVASERGLSRRVQS